MKIFQIRDNAFVHWDATKVHPTLASTRGLYSTDILFVEAPDYVFEHWGYDPSKTGDARFIQPIPPEGWVYTGKEGLFQPIGGWPVMVPQDEASVDELKAKIHELEAALEAAWAQPKGSQTAKAK